MWNLLSDIQKEFSFRWSHLVVLRRRRVTKRTSVYVRERGKERRPHSILRETFFVASDAAFLRFTTFLIVWNSLSTAQIKEEKYFTRSGPIWTGFREHRATARTVAAQAPGGDGVLSLQRQQFPSTFPLFNYTLARPPAFAAGMPPFVVLDEASPPPRVFPVRSIFAVPLLLRRLRVSRLYSSFFVTYRISVELS